MGVKHLVLTLQFPAIAKNSEIIIDPDLVKMDEKQLKLVAEAMDGELIYLKLHSNCQIPEKPLCITKDCYEPALDKSDNCEKHSYYKGIPLFSEQEKRLQS